MKYNILTLVKYSLALSFFLSVVSCSQSDQSIKNVDYTQYVNTFIGTGGTGHTFPGAAFPLGLVQLSPNTGNYTWDYHSGYQFNDTTVRGFAHTHLSGGGNPVLGDVLMLPLSDEKALFNQYVPFSKKEEKASPGYYSTFLTDDKILVELSVTPRTGIHRYTFQEAGQNHIFINIDEVLVSGLPEKSFVQDAWFSIENDSTISGYLRPYVKRVDRKVYFTINLNKPFSTSRFLDEPRNRKLVLDFNLKQNDQIEARVAISTVSIEGAKMNLEAESLNNSFEEIRKKAANHWNTYLSKIVIDGTPEQKEQFYTSMYHLFIQPNNIADVNGHYRGADDSIYVSPDNQMYSTFAFWDTYRAANPLYTILIPDKIGTFVNSALKHYDEKGYLPVWSLWGKDSHTMIGNHSVPTIVEACLKDLEGINKEKAFEAIKITLTKNSWRKYDWSVYDKYGYLPIDKVDSESVSRTIEATYDDWSAAQLAKVLGKHNDYEFFLKRSNYYKNLWNPETKFFRGKDSDGKWRTPFDPLKIQYGGSSNADFTEANAWQYLWHVQHDVNGLIELMGGNEIFSSRLDTLFNMHSLKIGDGNAVDVSGLIGQYAHGNEPSQHVAFLYNYVGKPYKTQELIREIIGTLYNTTPEGYCGNNDFGQMSAWYILNSLGFYPVNPASGIFDIGIPAHPLASIKLNGKEFKIIAENFSPENKYVSSVTMNGKPIDNLQISYKEIMQGGELIFKMTNSFDEK